MKALSVFLAHILRIQDEILRVKYINSTDFHSKLCQNQHAKVLRWMLTANFEVTVIFGPYGVLP